MPKTTDLPGGVVVRGEMKAGYEKLLTPEALTFVAGLERKFGGERHRLLGRRAEIQRRLDGGWKPDFLPETQDDPRRRLEGGADSARHPRPPYRDYRPD